MKDKDNDKQGFGTRAVHAGVSADLSTGAVMTPIYQTSTYVQSSPNEHKGYDYSRAGNPTRTSLEANVAALEGGKYGLTFASGMAAADAVLRLLEPGDEIVAIQDLYGGTYRLLEQVYAPMGIKTHYVRMDEAASLLEHYFSTSTRLVWVETPTNPTLGIVDIASLAPLAHKYGARLVVDNTFATPYLQQPLAMGADLVMHSVTKYMGGHSDLVMGALATSNKTLYERLYFIQKSVGAVPGPQDCFLALRGLKTLHVRMARHCENAALIAQHLNKHKAIEKIFFPGLKTHPQHQVAKKQMKAYGGMISFYLQSEQAAKRFLSRLRLFKLAESLGGVESLASHPASMTHASIPEDVRKRAGVTPELVRLSVGIEDTDDLIQDLTQAL